MLCFKAPESFSSTSFTTAKNLNISAYVIQTRLIFFKIKDLDIAIFGKNGENFQKDIWAIFRDICVKAYGVKLISRTTKLGDD